MKKLLWDKTNFLNKEICMCKVNYGFNQFLNLNLEASHLKTKIIIQHLWLKILITNNVYMSKNKSFVKCVHTKLTLINF